MSIILSKNGQKAQKIDKTPFGLEDKLQQYIYDNPESIPLYEIKEDIHLLILARELNTKSGPIDAFGIDKQGEIYLVETKLYKNPDKRTVVAQVLDYGASLWKHFTDFDGLLVTLNNRIQEKFNSTLDEKLQNHFTLTNEELNDLLDNMKHNLDQGNFKFVVLMDNLESRLKDLIIYINQNSAFDIYGVELEYYKHDEFEIIIPKLYGAEVKKEVGNKKSNLVVFTEEDFLKTYAKINLREQVEELLALHNKINENTIAIPEITSKKTPKNINFYYNPKGKNYKALTVSIGINNDNPGKTLDFWCNKLKYYQHLSEAITTHLKLKLTKPAEAKRGIIAKWDLQDFNSDNFLNFLQNL